jgi:hypothetical protein
MMASYDWRIRHAGLMAIAAIGEGTGKVRFAIFLVGDAKRTRKNCRVGFFSLHKQQVVYYHFVAW